MTADVARPADLLGLFPEHSSVTPDGELLIGGVGARDLAERFGTPAYIVDEVGLRNQARRMRDGLAARHPFSEVVFASKSFPCLAAYQLFAAEGLSIDVAGAGELVMALARGPRPSACTCTATPRPPPS
jgi:diaminopimelate decarboxylase